jgi:CubicO group peptidase (beta-lactamase class C family)
MPDVASTVRRLLDAAVAARVTPGAIVEAGSRAGAPLVVAVGGLTYDADAAPVSADTVYDLASLTKVIATTTLAMHLVDHGALGLDASVASLVPAWRGADRAPVTVRDLLLHQSGLPGWRPYFQQLHGLGAYEAAIAAEPLAYPPRTRSVYSDLGFILLGAVLARRGGAPLDRQFDAFRAAQLGPVPLRYGIDAAWLPRVAPTEQDAWRGRLLRGEVHDENCAALDGVAGHAGLFGTAAAVGAFARWILRGATGGPADGTGVTRSTLHEFLARGPLADSSRALGWDTMLPTSSCGAHFSAGSVGHTGFTGTSLWIDLERDRYVVLLTNRVHPTREGDAIQPLRRAVHDLLAASR